MAQSFFEKIFQRVAKEGIMPYTRKSRAWFLTSLKDLRTGDNRIKTAMLKSKSNDIPKVSKPLIGRMYMYVYDPKTKETLSHYDRFPLILMVGPAPGGFYGINLHYLTPRIRAVFFDRLTDLANNTKLDETTKLRMSYQLLKSASRFRAFQPCFKRYLYKHIRSRVIQVLPKYWEIAVFLPCDQFVGKHRNEIWKKQNNLL